MELPRRARFARRVLAVQALLLALLCVGCIIAGHIVGVRIGWQLWTGPPVLIGFALYFWRHRDVE